MLTNDQCIQIATEVWGWKFDKTRELHTDGLIFFQRTDKDEQVGLTGLRRDIESWTGFGRTVEAMAKADHYPYMNEDHEVFFFHKNSLGGGYRKGYSYNINKIETLIEATHLAALEALK